ncbi:metallophosphoesterase family protein [Pseudomonas viridiflava]|uniref:Phosphoesterase n=1 Tax=Pseudomonas viridiflava TaxID=33069 RepID=A0A3M5P2W1_PSEVI|nr:metallophosphoesterase family protein [Pseudomonas viridiflava]MBA1232317.1 metallophosphoesterase family protein [Pseudomonas viridiflava]RMT78595.1 Phosphoesterase [Pseudomonas viridiflava]
MKIGIISDTHGLLRPEAVNALQGCEQVIHAGDIGSAEIVEQLKSIAPLHIVRGNNDVDLPWASDIADHLLFDLNGWHALLVHDIADAPALLDERTRLVITGHSHKPLIEWRGDRLYINPGSAGRRRFKLPVTLVVLEVRASALEPELVQLLD